MRYALLFAGLAIAAFTAAVQAGAASGRNAQERANLAAAEIIDMRSSLAKEFIKPGTVITADTFKQVCGAVGKRVKELVSGGLEIRHAAVKYRNPANAATDAEAALMERFAKEAALQSVGAEFERGGKHYYSVTRPIYVEQACLACHGDRYGRPEFIIKKYPDDRAFGFKVGDLRGIITVTAPIN